MTIIDSPTDRISAQIQTITALTRSLGSTGCAVLPSEGTAVLVGDAFEAFADFAREWEQLALDTYMADGGTYRRRRYGRFTLDNVTGRLEIQPHGPYRQDSGINHLNGGIDRHFEPSTASFSSHPVLLGLLRGLGEVYTVLEACPAWEINLHPYRIIASHSQPGQPAPEGRHRDGVTFILTMMVDRHAVVGGESSVYTDGGYHRLSHTLTSPGELLLGDDRTTLHSVTPVTPSGEQDGHRDVLVVAFTSVGAEGTASAPEPEA